MPLRKAIAYVVGLAGCASVGWGFHGVMTTGSCGDVGQPVCPDDALWWGLAMVVGAAAAMIATFSGARLLIPALFLAFAAGSAWAAADLAAGSRTAPLVVAGVLAAMIPGQLAIVWFVRRKWRSAARLLAEGAAAVGTVTRFQDTGVTVNDDPQVKLTLWIKPADGSPAFQGETRVLVSRLAPPYRGQRFSVRFDPTDRRRFVLGDELDADRPASAVDSLDRLAKLNELRLAGALTEEEFDAQKARILADQS